MNLKEYNYMGLINKEPYPAVNIDSTLEPEVVSLLITSYSGVKGEITAIFQYSYQSFYNKPTSCELHEILEEISINEMVHLEVLSQILLSQKIDPKFCRYIDNNKNICEAWSTNNVNYEKDIEKFLKYNIFLEQAAIDVYNEIINKTSCLDLKSIINRIVEDEKVHLKIFNNLLSIISNKNST